MRRATAIKLIIVMTVAITAAAIVANRWPAATNKSEPPTTYAEAIEMRNATVRAIKRLERECRAVELNSAEHERLSARVVPLVEKSRRLEQRIEELK